MTAAGTNVLTRAYAATLEIRDDGRTIVGIAVPYGQETRIGRYVESFAPGAFADAGTHTPHRRTPEGRGRATHRSQRGAARCAGRAAWGVARVRN